MKQLLIPDWYDWGKPTMFQYYMQCRAKLHHTVIDHPEKPANFEVGDRLDFWAADSLKKHEPTTPIEFVASHLADKWSDPDLDGRQYPLVCAVDGFHFIHGKDEDTGMIKFTLTIGDDFVVHDLGMIDLISKAEGCLYHNVWTAWLLSHCRLLGSDTCTGQIVHWRGSGYTVADETPEPELKLDKANG